MTGVAENGGKLLEMAGMSGKAGNGGEMAGNGWNGLLTALTVSCHINALQCTTMNDTRKPRTSLP